MHPRELSAEEIAQGLHRTWVGDLFDELGRLQLDYLIGQGLQPHHRLLDLGCGCLRAGVHLVRFLDHGNYYGIDVNRSLLDAGYEVELPAAGLAGRLPRANLLVDGSFAATAFGVRFDIVLAQSLWTHLPCADVVASLGALVPAMAPGATLHATIFPCPELEPMPAELTHHPCGIVSFAHGDPFHLRRSDLLAASNELPWRLEELGPWNHPRGQHMSRWSFTGT